MNTRKRFLSTALALSLLAACGPKTGRGAGMEIIAGGVVTAVGLSAYQSGKDTDYEGSDPAANIGAGTASGMAQLVGLGIATVGALLVLDGAYALSTTEESAAQDNTGWLPGSRPAVPASSADDARRIDIRLLRPLPVVECDAETLRMAQQARRLAHEGLCEPARQVMKRLVGRDPVYASHMKASTVLDPC